MGADAMRKEARRRKFAASATDSPPTTRSAVGTCEVASHKAANRSLGDKKGKESLAGPISQTRPEEPAEAGLSKPVFDADACVQDKANEKNQKFIVFIGNLPYTATDESISKHFSKVAPKSIRHRTVKETGKSKGFAFLEFEGYDRMKTCLKLYHGSSFDDGVSPLRKLNIELTAGGGGRKSTDRKAKIRIKNQRLKEQRIRRACEEKQSRKGKNEKIIEQERRQSQEHEGRATIIEKPGLKRPFDNGDIHPSRRGRIAIVP